MMTCGTRCGFVQNKNHAGSSSGKEAVYNQSFQARPEAMELRSYDQFNHCYY